MVDKVKTSRRNIIDLARYRDGRAAGHASALLGRICRHCGAALAEGEREDECSSAFNFDAARLRGATRQFYAD
jgi:hypothetical protein